MDTRNNTVNSICTLIFLKHERGFLLMPVLLLMADFDKLKSVEVIGGHSFERMPGL